MSSRLESLLMRLQTEQLELAQKHEEDAFRLAREQKFELQKRHLIQTEDLVEELRKKNEKEGNTEADGGENNAKADLMDDLEDCRSLVGILTQKASKADSERSKARELGAKIVDAVNTDQARRKIGLARKTKGLKQLKRPVIGLKRVGSIDEAPWARFFNRRYDKSGKNYGSIWDHTSMKEELLKWQKIIEDPDFHPFNNVQTGTGQDTLKRVIDEHAEPLSSLKRDYGVGVYKSVTTALMELEEYNASGRYPVSYAWNFEESRVASFDEILSHLEPVIEAFVGLSLTIQYESVLL